MAAAATHKHKNHTRTTQDGERTPPDSLHKILIWHNSSNGLGICPVRLKLLSYSLSVLFLSGLPLGLVRSKVEMAIGSAVTKSWGIVFTSVCQMGGGEQLGRNSNPLEEPKGSSPFPLCVAPTRTAFPFSDSRRASLSCQLPPAPHRLLPQRLRCCSDRHKQ